MASFPPAVSDTIDWSNVGFKVREVNGHVESTYSVATGQWSPLKFVKSPFLRIHGMAPALNYGQQAYEGLKAFRGPGDSTVQVFRPNKNAVRLQHSAAAVSMPAVPEALFTDAVMAAVARNAEFVPPHATGAAMYIRPLLFGSSAQLALQPPDEYTFCVFVMPTGVYHGVHPVKCLILEDFDRAAPHGTGNAKVGGNYAPVLRHSDKARSEGYGITLHLDSKSHSEVDEFSTSGFIGAKVTADGRTTLVVPDSQAVIDSVTSDSVQQLGRSLGWAVEKRAIKYAEIAEFSEVMAAGTAAALVPIRSITRRIGRGEEQALVGRGLKNVAAGKEGEETITFLAESVQDAGPICLKLLSQLQGIQLGKIEDTFGWVFPVKAEHCTKVQDE
ncbi:hypothetical protein TD95_005042 [Thielaviopsis punctulata]|uniref:Branched-chain-amino-acid aminotransferase n=1 Tax=Thielaviopsis punctulata TaxID=72032 RepID=A0A0F4ZJJ2_9PEZI|nr:hypothetical protein TD95_005042 [Thielaviopsis punctulata]